MPPDLATQLHSALREHTLPLPSLPWLRAILPTRIPPPPLPPLIATARTRLLAADLTTPGLLDPAWADAHLLPRRVINNAEIDTARLPTDVVLQVVDIENVSRSRWDQVEELEAIARGEQTRGREVIRLPVAGEGGGDGEEEGGGGGGNRGVGNDEEEARGGATHKLVLQDCKGQRVCAIELKRVPRVGVGVTNIGEKVMLRQGTKIARGVLLLDPDKCSMLGGRIDAWHKPWVEGRLTRLKDAVDARGR